MFRTVLFVLMLLPLSAFAENWAQFRGPNFNGSTTESHLPARWSETENVVWIKDLPGPSAASPIVWEDKVFISSTDAENDLLLAMCLDRPTGNILWKHTVAEGISRDTRSNFAAPTPATDGQVVVFFYGSGPMVTYNLDGQELWRRNIPDDYGEFAFQWTFSTSPLLYDGRLYLQVLQRDTAVKNRGFKDKANDSYLLALDPKTGRELWRIIRPSAAKAESREAFTTPTPYHHNGRDELLVAGGDALTGHDPDTGEELWRWGTWNPERIGHWRLVPSPVAGGGVILACAPKKEPIYAIKAGGNGVLGNEAIAWTSVDPKVVSSDVPTPAFAYGDFFVLNKDRKMIARIEPTHGKIKWQQRVPTNFEASPLVADEKVYIINHDSQVLVFDAGTGEEMHSIEMDKTKDRSRSSIVAAQGQLFIRTTNKLFCIAEK